MGKVSTWRSSVVGGLIVALIVARVAFKHEAIFDGETISLFGVACSLILGTDKLLGLGGK